MITSTYYSHFWLPVCTLHTVATDIIKSNGMAEPHMNWNNFSGYLDTYPLVTDSLMNQEQFCSCHKDLILT